MGGGLLAVLAPGLDLPQAVHLVSLALFCTRQTSHDQLPGGGPKLVNDLVPLALMLADGWFSDTTFLLVVRRFLFPLVFSPTDVPRDKLPLGWFKLEPGWFKLEPGLGAEHATHILSVGLLLTKHFPHSHDPDGGANCERALSVGALELVSVFVGGLGAEHTTHTLSVGLLLTKHLLHSHDPDGGANCERGLSDEALDVESVFAFRFVLATVEIPDLAPAIVLIPPLPSNWSPPDVPNFSTPLLPSWSPPLPNLIAAFTAWPADDDDDLGSDSFSSSESVRSIQTAASCLVTFVAADRPLFFETGN